MRKDLHDLIDDKNLNSKTRLFEEVVFYLLRTHGKPIKEYHARFTSVADFSNTEVTAPRFRADLHETAYVGVTLKFFAAYAALVADSTSERRLVALGQRYGLTQRDSRRVVNMFRDLEVRKKTVSVLNADGIDHLTVDLNAYNDAITVGHELVVGLRDSITTAWHFSLAVKSLSVKLKRSSNCLKRRLVYAQKHSAIQSYHITIKLRSGLTQRAFRLFWRKAGIQFWVGEVRILFINRQIRSIFACC
jgi:hypothetical protein